MASVSISPELTSMDAFVDVVSRDAGSPDTAQRLCAVGRYCALGRGEALGGEASEDLLVFIANGAAKLTASSIPVAASRAKGHAAGQLQSPSCTHVLAFHFAGDIVSVLRRSGGDFGLAALCPTDLVVFSAGQFLDVAQDDPVIIRTVLTGSLQALHRSRTRMMQLGYKSARQRLAGFLLAIARRLHGAKGMPLSATCEVTLPMSRGDIADSLGLTLETVSRQFAELREAGLVVTQGRSLVRLTDTAALAREAGEEFLGADPPPV